MNDSDQREAIGALADGHRPTDSGNADRLAAVADGRVRFVPAWQKWLVYNDGRWTVDHSEALIVECAKSVAHHLFRTAITLAGHDRDVMLKWAKRSESAACIAAMIRLARGIPGVLVDHDQLDVHPWLLNVQNGTIDLRTGELLEHDPEHLLTCQAPVSYEPGAPAPLWAKCLDRWQPDPEIRDYLKVLVGSAATGVPVEILVMFLGNGANGKGKFVGAIAETLGSNYYVVPDKSLLVAQRHEQHATVKARLLGARMAVAAETEAGDHLDEASIKELTGGDLLEARRMREDPWPFMPSHTLFLHTNNRPRIRGGDEGIWRRVRLIPWSVTIPPAERDPHLATKLAQERSGVLNWIIDGARTFHDHGFTEPSSVTAATSEYRGQEDHIGRFLADCCTLGDDRSVPTAELRQAYVDWCEDVGEEAWTQHAMAPQLKARDLDPKRLGKARTRTWVGIDLLRENPENSRGDRL